MAACCVNTWEVLFQRALVLIEDARSTGLPVDDWTFGGGTVLMRRYQHRLSKDVDIFINDPQFIGYLTPRLSPMRSRSPQTTWKIGQVLQDRRDVVLSRIRSAEHLLRADFALLTRLGYQRDFDECLHILRNRFAVS